jgi:hypothetical protein
MGLPDSTLRGWQARHWQRGQHYIIVGKTTLLNPDEVQSWLEAKAQQQKASTNTLDRTESASITAEKRTPRLIQGT